MDVSRKDGLVEIFSTVNIYGVDVPNSAANVDDRALILFEKVMKTVKPNVLYKSGVLSCPNEKKLTFQYNERNAHR